MSKTNWDTPARLDGLPCTNWKRRTGVTLDGCLADCVTRWLSLADHHKRDCTLGWGPTADAQYGRLGAVAIGAYVLANGLPPAMAAERGGQPARHVLEQLTAMGTYSRPPGPNAIGRALE
jgi:hypothetical protein